MNRHTIQDLDYSLVDPNNPFLESQTEIALVNRAFDFWLHFWNRVFEKNGSSHQVDIADFRRQNVIAILSHANEIIGLHCYTIFDLRQKSASMHPYFANLYTEEFLTKLQKRPSVHRVISMEYLSIDSRIRRKITGVPLGHVLAGLGVLIAESLAMDGIITCSRNDVPATQYMHSFGGESLVKDLTIYNTPCDLVCVFREKMRLPEDPTVSQAIHDLWSRKQIYNDLFHPMHHAA